MSRKVIKDQIALIRNLYLKSRKLLNLRNRGKSYVKMIVKCLTSIKSTLKDDMMTIIHLMTKPFLFNLIGFFRILIRLNIDQHQ